MRSCQRTQRWPCYGRSAFEAIWKGEKACKWVSHELTKNQKNCNFEVSHLLLFYTTAMNHFSIGLWCERKSGFYPTTSDDQLSSWTHFPKPKLAPKKYHGHWRFAASMTHSLQLSESWWNHCIREVRIKSMIRTKNCNACSWHWSTEWVQFSTTMPHHMSHSKVSKVERIGL